jgi:hypothetical protein
MIVAGCVVQKPSPRSQLDILFKLVQEQTPISLLCINLSAPLRSVLLSCDAKESQGYDEAAS